MLTRVFKFTVTVRLCSLCITLFVYGSLLHGICSEIDIFSGHSLNLCEGMGVGAESLVNNW